MFSCINNNYWCSHLLQQNTSLTGLTEHRIALLKEVKENILSAQEKQQRNYDQKHERHAHFEVKQNLVIINLN